MNFFKSIFLLALISFFTLAAHAQEGNRNPLAKRSANSNTETPAQKETNLMAEELGLDDTQKQALLELNEAKHQARIDRRNTERTEENETMSKEDARAVRKEAAKTARKEYSTGLKAILSAEQLQMWQEKKKAPTSKEQMGKSKNPKK